MLCTRVIYLLEDCDNKSIVMTIVDFVFFGNFEMNVFLTVFTDLPIITIQ